MAIALHGSSPALVTDEVTGDVTTGAFSPPEQSLLVAMAAAPDDGGSGLSVSGGGLTWTRRIQRSTGFPGYAEIWTAPCAAGASGIAITLTSVGAFGVAFSAALKVDVYTGADLLAPVGATGQGSTTTNNATINAYTSTVAESRGVCAAHETGSLGLPSSTDQAFPFALEWMDGLVARKASNTAALGTVQFNLDAAGTGAADWQWAALEILPAITFIAPPPRVIGQAVNRASTY